MVRTGVANVGRDHRAAANCSFVGALLFVISALLFIEGFVVFQTHLDRDTGGGERGAMLGNQRYKDLNVTHLQARWRGRQEAQGVAMVAELTGALAWFSLMAPVGSMSALLGGETRSANGILIACFNAVALLTLIELTFQAGMMGLVGAVSEWPVLANADAHEHDGGFGALQSLEISFMVTRSRTAWLFAMDELLLSLGWALTAFLVYTSRGADQPISRPFAHLSVVGSVVALIGFFFHVAKEFSSMNMIAAAAITTALVYLFLLPAWLIMLGFQLRARSEAVAYADASKDSETELASTPNPAGASTSTQLPSSGAGAGAFHADETV